MELTASAETLPASSVETMLDSPSSVIGVQSEAAPAAYRSWRARQLVEDKMETFAEGLATRTAFELPQRILQSRLDDFVLVSDDELRAVQRTMIEATRNLIESAGASTLAGGFTYTSGGSLFANITPNNHLMSYQTSEEKLASVYITEKVDRKTGWQYVCLEEEWTRGYLQEIQDFMECAATGRQPLSDLALAQETIRVNYAGYWAAEEGRRVTL